MKFNTIYNNFSAGELSRNLIGRTDIEEYFKGAAEITNFIPTKQGGLSFRPGTVCEGAGFPAAATALFEFSPRDNENYILRLRPGGSIEILNITGSSTTTNSPAYPWNTHIDFTDATTAYSTPVDDNAHREIVDSLQIASSGDIVVVVDGRGIFAPILIMRTAANVFYVESFIQPSTARATVAPFLYPPQLPLRTPYKDPNINTEIRLVPSATTGTITITSQNAAAAAIPFFLGDVVGMLIKITHGTTTGVAQITAKASDSSVTALVRITFGAAVAQTNFQTAFWNPEDGYPKTVCFHEGRLIFGGNKKYQDMVWCSLTGNIYHFMQRRLAQDSTTDASGLNYFGAVKVTDPFNFVPASVGANSIQWMQSSDSLLVGTTGTEFSITGGQESSISVSSIFVKAISSHGSAKVQPIKVGSSLIFVSIDGKRLLEIPKRLVEYTSATDWTGMASGIVEKSINSQNTDFSSVMPLQSNIIKIVWEETNGILWVICKNILSNNTSLISLTVDKTSKVIAWAKHNIGGVNSFISSLTSIIDKNNSGIAKVYIMLKRNGAAIYSYESFTFRTAHDSYIPLASATGDLLHVYMDGSAFGITNISFPTSLALDSDQLDRFPSGSTYGVIEINDGIGTYIGSFVESGGGLTVPTLDVDKQYIIGALYEGMIKTMPSESGAQFGVAQGSARRTHEISVFTDRSLGGLYRASKSANEFAIVASKGSPESLYTGEVKLSLNASPDDHQIILKQTTPYPLTILWLLTKGYTYDA